ncbi:homoserine O-succinyltransferase MetX [Sphingomonas ginkgonis]|nr:homoserine O-succinyltransferase [Sphingomonas ginkgonis]
MTLSVLSPRSLELNDASVEAECRPAPVVLHEVPLPVELARYGDKVRAALAGNPLGEPVVVLGGISADACPLVRPDGRAGWWPRFVGPGGAVDPALHRIIGLDFAADESGDFAPSTADQADVVLAALDALGSERPVAFVGASYGAMVGLALAERAPERVARLVVISAACAPHPASTAIRELQRRVVCMGLRNGCGEEALTIARGMGMMTYRTPQEFAERFEGGIEAAESRSCSAPGDYLRSRGDAFLSVMSPGRFLSLSASIDRHRIDPARIGAPTLLIGVTSDQLVSTAQMETLSRRLGGPAELHFIDSLYGHDAFLKEADRMAEIARPFLAPAA